MIDSMKDIVSTIISNHLGTPIHNNLVRWRYPKSMGLYTAKVKMGHLKVAEKGESTFGFIPNDVALEQLV